MAGFRQAAFRLTAIWQIARPEATRRAAGIVGMGLGSAAGALGRCEAVSPAAVCRGRSVAAFSAGAGGAGADAAFEHVRGAGFEAEIFRDGSKAQVLAAPAREDGPPGTPEGVSAFLREGMAGLSASLVGFLGERIGVTDYHFQVMPVHSERWPGKGPAPSEGGAVLRSATVAGFMVRLVTDRARTEQPPEGAGGNLSDLDEPISYTDKEGKVVTSALCPRDLIVSESRRFRASIDAQGRAVLVITPKRYVRAMPELEEDELQELWQLVPRTLEAAGLRPGEWQDIRINAGSFQNLPHLHLKIFVHAAPFERCFGGHARVREARGIS